MKKTLGVLAIQGAFREHRKKLENLGYEIVEVKSKEDLNKVQGLIIPGGESTAIGKQLEIDDFGERIKERAREGMPVFGTCAGMILVSKEIQDSNQYRLGLMDTLVKRNAFGRQIASFEAEIPVEGFDKKFVRGVFIRAPYVLKASPQVDILGRYEDKIVFVRQGNLLASAFHPELTEDNAIHQYFVKMVDEYQS